MRLGRSPSYRRKTKVSCVSPSTHAKRQDWEARPLLRTITSSAGVWERTLGWRELETGRTQRYHLISGKET